MVRMTSDYLYMNAVVHTHVYNKSKTLGWNITFFCFKDISYELNTSDTNAWH